jgi:PKD domain
MKKKFTSETGAFNPRAFAAFTLASAGLFLALFSFAATPPSGLLTDTSGPIMYTAGPFFQSNQSPVFELDSGPRCDQQGFPCDTYKLTLNLPSGYAASHPKATVRATMSWTDTGSGQAHYDIYIFKTPRNDCNPNDCTLPDGSEQADSQSASFLGPRNPQVAYVAVTSDTQTYTVMIIPNTPSGETVKVVIDLLPGTDGALTAGFGGPDPTKPGVPRYMTFNAPAGTSAQPSSGEFNIGYNPGTGRIMTMNSGPIWRITPAELLSPALPECCEGLWEDKSSGVTDTGLDPILWTDQKAGRTFASNSTAGANAVYAYSDDDGDSWTPVGIAPPNGGADHETIGSGPYPASVPLGNDAVNKGRAVYYCSQDVVGPASCQRSDTFGASYGPAVLAYNGQGSSVPGGNDCGGTHGHLHVAPDGTVWLPVPHCGDKQGGAFSTDAGNTWTEFKVPNGFAQKDGADPSIGVDSDGVIYFAYVRNEPVGQNQPPEGHAHVAVGKRNPDNTITWLNDTDIGATHGVRNAVEIEAVGGSSGRAGVGFIGTDLTGDYEQLSFPGQWYAFIATTYDQGKTWVTVNATPNDPVQNFTGVWQQGGAQTDRNLLDFNEITVDKNGRVLYGYSDGCVTIGCIGGTAANDFVAFQRVARQTGGKSLFASFDAFTDTTAPILAKAPCLSGERDVTGSHLTWKVPDNGGSDIVEYFIYRGTTAGGENLVTPIGRVAGDRTTYTDATADPTVTDYFYEVRAVTTINGGLAFGAISNEVDLKVTPITVPPAAFSCSGTNVVLDAAGDAHDPAPNAGLANTDQADITAISFSADLAKKTLTTKLTIKNLSSTPSAGTDSTIYWVTWKGPDNKLYATRHVEPDPAGNSYTYGQWDGSSAFVSGTTHSTTGTVTTGPNGTITVDVPLADVGNPIIPVTDSNSVPAVRQPYSLVFGGEGFNGAGVFFTSPMDRAPDTGGGQSWAVCLPANAAPTAILTATPDHGGAPLTVTLDGSLSTDPDAGDTIASYTFDFGDSSAPVTQASPTISHTYSSPGQYPARLRVTDSRGLLSTNTALVNIEVNAALRNISTRENVQTGDNVLIAGFIVTGNDPRQIVIRGIGPSVKINGQPLAGAMQDPTIELHDPNGGVTKNDNWKIDDATGQSQQTAIENTGVAPTDDRESALVRSLTPGTYTVVLRGKNNATGIALVEVYDLDPFANSKLANISTRGFVQTGDSVMIAGFVAGPANSADTGILIRGIGPSLSNHGISNPLSDPTLELHDANGATIRSNDNWKVDDRNGDSQQAAIESTGLAPTDDRESAILTDIAPGNYTAILAGKNGTTGVGLVEIYNVH